MFHSNRFTFGKSTSSTFSSCYFVNSAFSCALTSKNLAFNFGLRSFWRSIDILKCYSYALLKDLYMMEVLTNGRQGFWLSGSNSLNLTLQLILYILQSTCCLITRGFCSFSYQIDINNFRKDFNSFNLFQLLVWKMLYMKNMKQHHNANILALQLYPHKLYSNAF